MAVRVLELETAEQVRAELERVGAVSSVGGALQDQLARARFYLVKLDAVELTLARLLYQELAMEGGQAVMAPRLDHIGEGETDVLLCGTRYQFDHLCVRLRWQASDELQQLADEIEQALERFVTAPAALDLGRAHFEWRERALVMGILNLTPDSFSGDGLIKPGDGEGDLVRRALERADTLVREGADILDIGGESTHPRAAPVETGVELGRVLPVVRELAQRASVPLSIDTSKARVAAAALEAGAVIVNDVTGLRGDADMGRVAAEHGAALVVMDNRTLDSAAPDTLGEVLRGLVEQMGIAMEAGVADSRIWIDPGLGFGKTPEQSLEILNRLGELRVVGAPIVIGPSRKGFISKATGVATDEREEGTAAAVAVGVLRGANVVRVHNVQAIARVVRMTEAIKGEELKVKS